MKCVLYHSKVNPPEYLEGGTSPGPSWAHMNTKYRHFKLEKISSTILFPVVLMIESKRRPRAPLSPRSQKLKRKDEQVITS